MKIGFFFRLNISNGGLSSNWRILMGYTFYIGVGIPGEDQLKSIYICSLKERVQSHVLVEAMNTHQNDPRALSNVKITLRIDNV